MYVKGKTLLDNLHKLTVKLKYFYGTNYTLYYKS